MTPTMTMTKAGLTGLALAVVLCLVGSSPASAQPAKGDDEEDNVSITKIHEHYKAEDWQGVVSAFTQFRNRHKAPNDAKVMGRRDLVFKYAVACYELKDLPAAVSALNTIISGQIDHVGALYLLAKIAAKDGQRHFGPNYKERIKDWLRLAAQAGQFVLRDINTKDGKAIFGTLASDPEFILSIMKASREFKVTRSADLHNPFDAPLTTQKSTEKAAGPTTDVKVGPDLEAIRKDIEVKVEKLFSDIETLAKERNVDELISKFTDLRQLMAKYGQLGSEAVKKKMEAWGKKLQQFGDVRLSIQLQIYINEGNQHLRAMAQAIKDTQYDKALEHFGKIKELKDQMYNEKSDVFHRNADALFLRGKGLADRAARLKRIAQFRLEISGIVLVPQSDEQQRHAAIVNHRIYREGDTILDDNEDEVQGLKVVEISKRTVRFEYQETPFVREMRTPSATAATAPLKPGTKAGPPARTAAPPPARRAGGGR